MFFYIWPIALAVLSNVVYHICAKTLSSGMHPLASLTVTYLTGAAASAVLYFLLNRDADLIREYGKLSPGPFVFGIVLVGLEVGFIYAYRAGWEIGTAAIVQSSFLAVALIFVGFLIYREALTWNKVVGIVICLIGLVFINMK